VSDRENAEVRRVVRLFYGFQFFFSQLFWVPVFYEYQKQVGLSDPEIFGIQSIYYLAFCLLEIPTGLIADTLGYRRCLRAGALVLVLGNLLPVVAPSYWGFLWHFLAVALARSFISGAASAYLYEYLAGLGRAHEYKGIEGKARAYYLLGRVVGWAAIGKLMQWQFSLPYTLSVVTAAVSVAFAWRLPLHRRAPDTEMSVLQKGRFAQTRGLNAYAIWQVIRLLPRHPIFLLLMFQGIAIFVLSRIAQVNLFNPILGERGFSVATYGMIMGGISVLEALGSAYPGWVQRFLSDANGVFVLTGVLALSLGGIAVSGPWGAVLCLGLLSYVVGLAFPIQRQLMNDRIPDVRYRATFLSLESILDRAVSAWVALAIGGYVASGQTNQFLLLSAGVTLASVLVLALALQVLNRPPRST